MDKLVRGDFSLSGETVSKADFGNADFGNYVTSNSLSGYVMSGLSDIVTNLKTNRTYQIGAVAILGGLGFLYYKKMKKNKRA